MNYHPLWPNAFNNDSPSLSELAIEKMTHLPNNTYRLPRHVYYHWFETIKLNFTVQSLHVSPPFTLQVQCLELQFTSVL
jgi:hypothetical protein